MYEFQHFLIIFCLLTISEMLTNSPKLSVAEHYCFGVSIRQKYASSFSLQAFIISRVGPPSLSERGASRIFWQSEHPYFRARGAHSLARLYHAVL
jgi:hypothetical protein